MIVDARAIGIQQAKYLLVGQPVPFIPEAVSGDNKIQPHDKVTLQGVR